MRRAAAASRAVGCVLLVGALVVAVLGSSAVGRARASGPPALHVIPFAGTPDASPRSPIIFSSLARSELASVTVSGSRSGAHPGSVSSLPGGAGTAFTPDHPFTPGEQVTVTATLSTPAAAATLGDPGARTISFSFRIARAAPLAMPASATPRAQAARGGPVQSYRSQPHLHPPALSATHNPDTHSGEIFLTPNHSAQRGPMILDSQGRLVWFHPVTGMAYNLQVQHYQGQPVLTWWQGGAGEDVIANRSYHVSRILHAANGYNADVHEFQLTPQGTALIDCVVPVHTNLSSVGGPSNGTVQDNVIQELDIRTGRLVWEWHTLGHIPISDSYRRPSGTQPYSYFHLNSIQQLPDGNLLISGANTWGVYKINRRTGGVMWELGGKHSSFRVAQKARFEWQHDPRLRPNGTLTVFDDATSPQKEWESSAKVLRLNMGNMTATLVARYNHSPPLLAARAGSVQILPDHDVFVGWGSTSKFSEYTPAGKQIFNADFPLGVYSYRAYRFAWSGQPSTRPALQIVSHAGRATVYVSWNGATQVATWKVLGGSSAAHLRSLATAPRSGFETVIRLRNAPHYLLVRALDSSGHTLASTQPQATSH